MKYLLSMLTLMFTFISVIAQAQIVASNMELRFTAKQKAVKNITISNQSLTSPFTVRTQVVELTNPGEKPANYIASTKLISIPAIFTLTPKEERKVRLISNAAPSKEERIFKVRFIPEAVEDLVEPMGKPAATTVTPQVQILTGVGILTSVAPKEPQEDLTWQRDETGIKFTNNGNFNVVIARKNKCLKGVCYQIPGKRLYANASWYLKLPEALRFNPVKLEVFTNGRPKEVIIPYEY